MELFFIGQDLLCTRVSDCPLLSLDMFLALIPRGISFTYTIDNGFKLQLDRVNLQLSLVIICMFL